MKSVTWVYAILMAVIFGLGFMQVKSCRDTTARDLQLSQDSLKKKNDSLNGRIDLILASDAFLRLHYSLDTARFIRQIDSLAKKEKDSRSLAGVLQAQLNKTIADLQDAVTSGDAAAQLKTIEDLKRQLSDLVDNEHFQGDVTDAKEGIYLEQLSYRDSVITQKNKTIDGLSLSIGQKDAIITSLNLDLDKAITQLKKGKKVNILRTIGEAALVVALIFKK